MIDGREMRFPASEGSADRGGATRTSNEGLTVSPRRLPAPSKACKPRCAADSSARGNSGAAGPVGRVSDLFVARNSGSAPSVLARAGLIRITSQARCERSSAAMSHAPGSSSHRRNPCRADVGKAWWLLAAPMPGWSIARTGQRCGLRDDPRPTSRDVPSNHPESGTGSARCWIHPNHFDLRCPSEWRSALGGVSGSFARSQAAAL